MDNKRAPLLDLCNVAWNEPNENKHETPIDDLLNITCNGKENELVLPSPLKPSAVKPDSNIDPVEETNNKCSIRKSFLVNFDPTYTNSPVASRNKKKTNYLNELCVLESEANASDNESFVDASETREVNAVDDLTDRFYSLTTEEETTSKDEPGFKLDLTFDGAPSLKLVDQNTPIKSKLLDLTAEEFSTPNDTLVLDEKSSDSCDEDEEEILFQKAEELVRKLEDKAREFVVTAEEPSTVPAESNSTVVVDSGSTEKSLDTTEESSSIVKDQEFTEARFDEHFVTTPSTPNSTVLIEPEESLITDEDKEPLKSLEVSSTPLENPIDCEDSQISIPSSPLKDTAVLETVAKVEDALKSPQKNSEPIVVLESAAVVEEALKSQKNSESIVVLESAVVVEEALKSPQKNSEPIVLLESAVVVEESQAESCADLDSAVVLEEKEAGTLPQTAEVVQTEAIPTVIVTETHSDKEESFEDCSSEGELNRTAIEKDISTTVNTSTVTDKPKNEIISIKMTDLADKLAEISELKLKLNASQQANASFELEVRQKEEIIIKAQAELQKHEQQYKLEIKELKDKLKEKSKIIEQGSSKEIEDQLKELKARETQLSAELNMMKKDDLNKQKIIEEYEKTISARLAEHEKLKAEHATATRHLANLELAFSDVHQKYERTKVVVEGFKQNEETLRQNMQLKNDTLRQNEERYETLRAHAKAQIEKSNKEILLARSTYEQDISKLKAVIKRFEIKSQSLEFALEQKSQECLALSALCDEVTGKKI